MTALQALASRNVGERLISARMLVLQSKRLILASTQRRFHDGNPALSERVQRLTMEASEAQHSYRTTVLEWGPDASAQYWPVAYSRLVEVGEVLATQLRGAVPGMKPAEGLAVATEVEALEGFIKGTNSRISVINPKVEIPTSRTRRCLLTRS